MRPVLPLEGQRFVVTGAAGGIGSGVALGLQCAGAYVTGIDRVEAISANETIIADLANVDGIRALSRQLADEPLDGLVNLAGVQYFGPFADEPAEDLYAGYMVNLLAPVMLTREMLTRLDASPHGGRIANIGSVFGAIPFAHFVTYSSAKAGLKGFSDALRRECAGRRISVTHVAPRAVKTPLATANVHAFAKATGMKMDLPDRVADQIVKAIVARRRNLVIGLPENLFVRINALAPGLVDRALAANDRKAAELFV